MNPVGLIIGVVLAAYSTDSGSVVSHQLPTASAGDWQTVNQPAAGEAMGLRHLCRRISYEEAAAKAPLPMNLTPVSADHPALRDLGALEYRGEGVEIQSDDPRFAALEIAPGRTLPRMPNGDFIEVSPYVWYGEDDRAARCFAPWNPPYAYLQADSAIKVPAEVSDQLQGHPDLRLIGAAPLGTGAWVALTSPHGEPGRTFLIRVAEDGEQPLTTVAELLFTFQVIEPVIDPHSPRRWVRLVGRGSRDEPIRVLLLEVPSNLL